MKILYLHRHAKAVKDGYEHDISRSLKPSGIEDAHRMGRYLHQRRFQADAVIASPASRAQQTARLLTEHTREPLRTDARLYGNGEAGLLQVLRELPESVAAVRLVGHNPDLEDLAAALCGFRPGAIHLPTCGVLCIQCGAGPWTALSDGGCTLEWHLGPAQL